ncbi:MAG TPA: hypothetical protein VGD00_10230 [Solirubrobacteraceae bacterium]
MRRAAVVLLAWGAWLGVLTAALLPFTRERPRPYAPHAIEYWMLGGAAGSCLAAGLVLWRLDARRRTAAAAAAGEPPRLIPDDSIAATTLAGGLSLALLGAGFGLWLVLMGAGVTALGAGGLIRETRARRRDLAAAGAIGGVAPRTSAGTARITPAAGAPGTIRPGPGPGESR